MSEASSVLAYHFDDVEQQRGAGLLGMWVFLITEVMFFGGLFLIYTVYRVIYPDAFADASRHDYGPSGVQCPDWPAHLALGVLVGDGCARLGVSRD